MKSGETPDYLQRIFSRLDALGLNENAASMLATGHGSTIKNIRNGKADKGPNLGTIRQLAAVLGVSPGWLAFGERGVDDPPAQLVGTRTLSFAGEVAAGRWLEAETAADAYREDGMPLAPNPRWPIEAQYAVITRGPCIDRIAPDGSALSCVDPRVINYQVQDGELVIAERRRFAGAEIERTAKIFRRAAGRCELWPDSNHPRWQEPIVIEPGEDEGTEIEIVGLVWQISLPVPLSQPWLRH